MPKHQSRGLLATAPLRKKLTLRAQQEPTVSEDQYHLAPPDAKIEVMIKNKEQLNLIINLGKELSHVEDEDLLLNKILQEARNLVNADAGSIYTKEKDKLKFHTSQNDTLQKRLPPGKKLIFSSFAIPINNKSIAGFVAGNDKMLNIPDVNQIPRSALYAI